MSLSPEREKEVDEQLARVRAEQEASTKIPPGTNVWWVDWPDIEDTEIPQHISLARIRSGIIDHKIEKRLYYRLKDGRSVFCPEACTTLADAVKRLIEYAEHEIGRLKDDLEQTNEFLEALRWEELDGILEP